MKNFLICISFFFVLQTVSFSQNISPISFPDNKFLESIMQLSFKQLYDSANYYFDKRDSYTALIYYNLLINKTIKNNNLDQQKIIVEALNKISVAYFHLSDYRNSYNALIQALHLCEKYNYESYFSKIFTNMGNIYFRFKRFDKAIEFYSKALTFNQDSATIVVLYNNLGAAELEAGNIDSAFYFLKKSLKFSDLYEEFFLSDIWNNMASYYHKKRQYDSAYYFYQASLLVARNNSRYSREAQNLSDLGRLFFDLNQTDSALSYIYLANNVANEYNFPRFIAENHLTLSKIKEAQGKTKEALEYYKEYSQLMDTLLNVENFGEISQIQRMYEVGKTNKQIEQLNMEKQIKARTIFHQKIILFVLLFTTTILLIVVYQKRNLNKAYKTLFEKNIEIIDLQKSSDKYQNKKQKTALADDLQEELMDRISNIMEDTLVICDPTFTINKLATMLQSNHTYVSQVINTVFEKNFRSFLNGYRIKEAQRLFSEPNASKYTIEAVSLQVGFKSRSAFREAFKEITGVSPNYYFKKIQNRIND
ncbi:MAG: AraC family transcriptional regulator [Bacteroidales bacterium]|jgi:AraC-like DNA-binding protein|nr:AraC family transcriptional regulator [Bacteroidales bacterium]